MAIGDEQSLKFWARVVKILGILLIAAILFTVIAVSQGLHKKTKSLKSSFSSSSSSECVGGEIKLKDAKNFKDIIFHDDKVSLIFFGKEKSDRKIVILDYCNNKIISEIIIED